MNIDFKRLSGDLLARASSLVCSWLPEGKRSGVEWVAKNPRRNDQRLGSFKINLETGIWRDFASGDDGSDLISLYAYIEDVSQGDAAKALQDDSGILQIKPQKVKARTVWKALGEPGPREATTGEMQWRDRGEVTHWWSVRDADNRILYYDVRFEKQKEDGSISKDVLPMCWCENEKGNVGWRFKSYPSPRPLYNFVAVAASDPKKPVIIVEGMKCAEAMATIIGDKFPIVTWQGGGKAIRKSDWSQLSGRRIAIWPDADSPGYEAAIDIIGLLEKLDCKISVIQPHEEAPETWDVADFIESGADRAALLGYLKSNRITSKEFKEHHNPEEESQEGQFQYEDPPPGYDCDKTINTSEDLRGRPFRVLGHDRDNYYYLPKAKGQIVTLKMSSHTKNNLLSLAPLQWWENEYETKKGANWTAAQNELMREADRKGPFSASKIRGRGAWRDKAGQDLIVHVGDHMVVNGTDVDPVSYEGQYIYERGVRLHQNTDKSAPRELGREIIELCKLFPWRSEVHGVLAAGWSFLAPICGALYWRPHIWITGEPGSGKSWFQNNVIAPFVRDFGVISQGSTTAAGIRQLLATDALPVLFDEAEPNDNRSADRIVEVLELMRQSSMAGESAIIKGSAQGDSVSYAPSSMWCLSSVVTAIKHQADQGRISILETCKYTETVAKAKGRSLREQHRITADRCARLFTRENCHELRSRAFRNLPTILETIEVFREVAADHFGNQRAGDQIGTLLAGAYCLASDGKIQRDVALKYITAQDWDEVIKEDDQEQDHEQLVRHILQHVAGVNTPADGRQDKTIAQLISIGMEDYATTSLNRRVARDTLSLFGIFLSESVQDGEVYISPKHRGIERILFGTPWSINYSRILMRIPGVGQTEPRQVTELDGKKTSRRLMSIRIKSLILSEFDGQKTDPKKQGDFWEEEGDY